MGRTIRRVPLNWQHPKDDQDRYIPCEDKTYLEAFREWQGERTYPEAIFDIIHRKDHDLPSRSLYRPAWPQGEGLGYQVYSGIGLTGIPVSPVFDIRYNLARWLIDVGGYSVEAAWLFIKNGTAKQPDHLRQQFGKQFDKFGGK